MKHSYNLARLGSVYGGWTYIDYPQLNNSTIISVGVGEDISFDVEFSKRYQSKIVLVDPTPRAILHFDKTILNIGQSKKIDYIEGGNQPILSYDLEGIQQNWLILIKKALWKDSLGVNFFEPKNKNYVSHSIIGEEFNPNVDSISISVPSITLRDILVEQGIKTNFELLKLDIEFAASNVILNMLSDEIYPQQILVEFEEVTTKDGMQFLEAHQALLDSGYLLANVEENVNYLYTRSNF